MVEQQAVGVPTEMAEFYEDFRINNEGTLLPTTMPVGILHKAFRFDHNPSEISLRQYMGVGDTRPSVLS